MTCKYYDCGWCYKKDSVYSHCGCVGTDECVYINKNEGVEMKDTKSLIEHLFSQQGLKIPTCEEDIYNVELVPSLLEILADLCEASGVYNKGE